MLQTQHTVSFQNFRSLPFMSFFSCTRDFFREIATFSSETLSFDIFFLLNWKMSTIIDFFYDFTLSFHLLKNQANPEKVSRDSDSLAKILNLTLNTP